MSTNHRVLTAAAAALALVPAGTPTAAAGFAGAPVATGTHPAHATIYSRQDKSLIPVTSESADGIGPEQAVVRIQAPASGFDWGDAGIGAAGGFALSMIGLGGVLVISQRRGRGPITPQA